MKTWFTPTILWLLLAISFGVFYYMYDLSEPKVVTEYKTLIHRALTIINRVEYIDREKVVEVPVKLKPFESLQQLAEWAARNKVEPMGEFRCVDEALELQRRAFNDGYILSTEIVGDGDPEGHMVCSTVIGDKIYFIEPTNGFVWLAGVKLK